MKIIDAHIHFSNWERFKLTAKEVSEVNYTAEGLKNEFNSAGIQAAVIMTTASRDIPESYGPVQEMRLDDGTPDNLAACIGVNAYNLAKNPEKELYYVEQELNKPYATGIKLYPGYTPFYVTDPMYEPVYDLARKYQVPVAIHCGDTSSPNALLKYAHPLTVDEAAVKHPDIIFVICHMGDPWVMDTAELIGKNHNVYTDLSGLIAGNKEHVQKRRYSGLFLNHFKQALAYCEEYEKLLFGTDWPLVPIEPYVKFVKALVPEEYHEDVFFKNALKVYPRLKELVI